MRRVELVHLTSLAIGCILFAACGGKHLAPRPSAARNRRGRHASANATTSWVNKGGSNCLPSRRRTTRRSAGRQFGNTGWYFCPTQTSASLYLAKDPLHPGFSLTLANISVLLGPEVPTS